MRIALILLAIGVVGLGAYFWQTYVDGWRQRAHPNGSTGSVSLPSPQPIIYTDVLIAEYEADGNLINLQIGQAPEVEHN